MSFKKMFCSRLTGPNAGLLVMFHLSTGLGWICMREQSVTTGKLVFLSLQSPRLSPWSLQLRLLLQYCVLMTWFDWIQNVRMISRTGTCMSQGNY